MTIISFSPLHMDRTPPPFTFSRQHAHHDIRFPRSGNQSPSFYGQVLRFVSRRFQIIGIMSPSSEVCGCHPWTDLSGGRAFPAVSCVFHDDQMYFRRGRSDGVLLYNVMLLEYDNNESGIRKQCMRINSRHEERKIVVLG